MVESRAKFPWLALATDGTIATDLRHPVEVQSAISVIENPTGFTKWLCINHIYQV